eukprot:3953809-Amphidinium_carterae.1
MCKVSLSQFVWQVLGFGGAEFPLVFCGVAALITRLSQGMFDALEVQFNTYIDDPIAVMQPSKPPLFVDLIILLWLCVGVPVSWKKGSLTSSEHVWIGVQFRATAPGL